MKSVFEQPTLEVTELVTESIANTPEGEQTTTSNPFGN